MEKVYIARVLGEFPPDPVQADVALSWDPVRNHVTAVPGGPRLAQAGSADAAANRRELASGGASSRSVAEGAAAAAARQPPSSEAARNSSVQAGREPKAALTRFRRLAVASDRRTSLVECR